VHTGDRASTGHRAIGRSLSLSPSRSLCQRCGFEVSDLAYGCKNPCPNCGTVYPLGDCSD